MASGSSQRLCPALLPLCGHVRLRIEKVMIIEIHNDVKGRAEPGPGSCGEAGGEVPRAAAAGGESGGTSVCRQWMATPQSRDEACTGTCSWAFLTAHRRCQFSPVMDPLLLGQSGPLAPMTLVEFLAERQADGSCLPGSRRWFDRYLLFGLRRSMGSEAGAGDGERTLPPQGRLAQMFSPVKERRCPCRARGGAKRALGGMRLDVEGGRDVDGSPAGACGD